MQITTEKMQQTIDLVALSERDEKVVIKMRLDGRVAKQFKSQIETFFATKIVDNLFDNDVIGQREVEDLRGGVGGRHDLADVLVL